MNIVMNDTDVACRPTARIKVCKNSRPIRSVEVLGPTPVVIVRLTSAMVIHLG